MDPPTVIFLDLAGELEAQAARGAKFGCGGL
jgi:hypothetical protein